MSLQVIAQDLASRGRGPDTTLVHMAPQEVAGLQALARAHGGSLTVNPETGLPEAGFLSAILPIVAGAALGPAGAGLFGSAMTAGLGVGALTGLATGNLKRGLMAGLGAYGGAGLMGSVMGAGTGAISAGAPGAAGTLTGADFAGQAASLSGDAAAMLNPGAGTLTGADFAGQAASLSGDAAQALAPQYVQGAVGIDPFGGYPAAAAATPVATVTQAVAATTFPGTLTGADFAGQASSLSSDAAQQLAVANKLAAATPLQTFQAGIGAIADKPALLFNKANLGYGLAAAAPVASYLMEPKKAATPPRDSEQYRYAYDPNRQLYPTRMGDVGEYTYFRPSYTRLAASGGIMDALPVEQMSARNEAETLMANGGEMYAEGGFMSHVMAALGGRRDTSPEVRYDYDPATQTYTRLAGGGISHLGDYSDGGRLLRGPGDGVSDDIPATIADKRPARLADGEFVVPARIVSELGNGSTDAGARKLYSMMDRVQKNRAKTVGKNKVAVDSRSEKLLPA